MGRKSAMIERMHECNLGLSIEKNLRGPAQRALLKPNFGDLTSNSSFSSKLRHSYLPVVFKAKYLVKILTFYLWTSGKIRPIGKAKRGVKSSVARAAACDLSLGYCLIHKSIGLEKTLGYVFAYRFGVQSINSPDTFA